MFILSDSPPEKDVQWSDEGMNSSYKFIQKLWTLNQRILEEIKLDHPKNKSKDLEMIASGFVENVKNNIENFSYNKIIANFYELYSAMNKILNSKIDKDSLLKNYTNILITMTTVIPHFANECLEMVGVKINQKNILWPNINKSVLIKEKVNFVVQINGKTRGVLELKINIDEKKVLEEIKNNQKMNNHIIDKTIKKTIFIPNKLINLII